VKITAAAALILGRAVAVAARVVDTRAFTAVLTYDVLLALAITGNARPTAVAYVLV
tara:strand:- start:202 stop:369 length:168 start_codon:yes stop_codon:yes gene_type:complete